MGQSLLPRPDHIVIVMFENKSYSGIVGSASAPYINSLIADTNTALFTQSYALTHPSQPNYLMLFSGSSQGVATDNISSAAPFTTCNLGASLMQAGFTFTGYCEDLPSAGYLGATSGLYYRKHNPWSNWQGTLANNIPASANQPFAAFPLNYNLLPDVCFIIPNINNCMHNGTINLGDTWLQSNLSAYVQWARSNNSLLILTFDEDDGTENNRITTLFHGPMIDGGSYSQTINHYNVLRTLEDIYNLTPCGSSATVSAINYIWKPAFDVRENAVTNNKIIIFPNPSKDHVNVSVKMEGSSAAGAITVTDVYGNIALKQRCELKHGENQLHFSHDLPAGIYMLAVSAPGVRLNSRFAVE